MKSGDTRSQARSTSRCSSLRRSGSESAWRDIVAGAEGGVETPARKIAVANQRANLIRALLENKTGRLLGEGLGRFVGRKIREGDERFACTASTSRACRSAAKRFLYGSKFRITSVSKCLSGIDSQVCDDRRKMAGGSAKANGVSASRVANTLRWPETSAPPNVGSKKYF